MNDGIRPDAAVRAHARVSQQLHKGFNDSIGADFDVRVNHTGFRIKNRHALGHKLHALLFPELSIKLDQLHSRITTQDFSRVAGLGCYYLLSGCAEDASHVREVVLAMRILCFKFFKISQQWFHREDIKTRVNFTNFSLLWRARFFFDHAFNTLAVCRGAENAPVPSWVLKPRAENGHRSFLLSMKFQQLGDAF